LSVNAMNHQRGSEPDVYASWPFRVIDIVSSFHRLDLRQDVPERCCPDDRQCGLIFVRGGSVLKDMRKRS
jgi:hypothetical protein